MGLLGLMGNHLHVAGTVALEEPARAIPLLCRAGADDLICRGPDGLADCVTGCEMGEMGKDRTPLPKLELAVVLLVMPPSGTWLIEPGSVDVDKEGSDGMTWSVKSFKVPLVK